MFFSFFVLLLFCVCRNQNWNWIYSILSNFNLVLHFIQKPLTWFAVNGNIIGLKWVKVISWLLIVHNSLKTNRNYRSNRREVFCKKGVVENFAKFKGKHLCLRVSLSFLIKLLKKRLWHKVFSCEFCEIFKNTFFDRTLLVAASVIGSIWVKCLCFLFNP